MPGIDLNMGGNRAAKAPAAFDSLSDDLLALVFAHLPVPDRGRLAQVNKSTARVARVMKVFADAFYVIKDAADVRRALDLQFRAAIF